MLVRGAKVAVKAGDDYCYSGKTEFRVKYYVYRTPSDSCRLLDANI